MWSGVFVKAKQSLNIPWLVDQGSSSPVATQGHSVVEHNPLHALKLRRLQEHAHTNAVEVLQPCKRSSRANLALAVAATAAYLVARQL